MSRALGMDPAAPQPGVDAYEIIRKIDKGEIGGLLSVCFNLSSPAGQQLSAGAQSSVAIDSLL